MAQKWWATRLRDLTARQAAGLLVLSLLLALAALGLGLAGATTTITAEGEFSPLGMFGTVGFAAATAAAVMLWLFGVVALARALLGNR